MRQQLIEHFTTAYSLWYVSRSSLSIALSLHLFPAAQLTKHRVSNRTYSYRHNTPRPRQVPSPSRSKDLHIQHLRMALHLRQGRHPRRLLRLVTHLPGLLPPRRRQIRPLRVLQALVRRHALPTIEPHPGLPRRIRIGRILCRHGPLPAGGDQGPHADHPAAVCE